MVLNFGIVEDSWESLGLQGDPTSPSWRRSVLNIHWKDWSWNSNTLATWCEKLTHWKRPWCWERLRAGGEGDDRGWDGWMPSLIEWIWIWASSGSWWWTRKPGVLQSMGSQRVRHDWVPELSWDCLQWSEKSEESCCVAQGTQPGVLRWPRELGWGRGSWGSSSGREHMHAYGWFTLFVCQKPTQHCKAIILQLKIHLKERNGKGFSEGGPGQSISVCHKLQLTGTEGKCNLGIGDPGNIAEEPGNHSS